MRHKNKRPKEPNKRAIEKDRLCFQAKALEKELKQRKEK